MTLSDSKTVDAPWHLSKLGNIISDDGFTTSSIGGIISIFVKSSANNYLTMIQLHPDTDNDHIFDAIDELDNAPNQWSDQDNDGFGDNENGPLYDDCSTQSGTSHIFNSGLF